MVGVEPHGREAVDEGCGCRFYQILQGPGNPSEVTSSLSVLFTALGTEWMLNKNHNSGNLSFGLYLSIY